MMNDEYGFASLCLSIEQTHKLRFQKSLPQHIVCLLNIYTPCCMQYPSGLSLCGGSIFTPDKIGSAQALPYSAFRIHHSSLSFLIP